LSEFQEKSSERKKWHLLLLRVGAGEAAGVEKDLVVVWVGQPWAAIVPIVVNGDWNNLQNFVSVEPNVESFCSRGRKRTKKVGLIVPTR
jgi:hypothetical protein